MNASELKADFPGLIESSVIESNGATFWIQVERGQKSLAVLAPMHSETFNSFLGAESAYKDGRILKTCSLIHDNALGLRTMLLSLVPVKLGLQTSVGFGDRLGIATPGHVRAMRVTNARQIAPIFAQQSIREMQRTGRSAENVLDDATFGALEAGWRGRLGADADHLKTPADIDRCAAAGFTFFTIDPGEYVDASADHLEGVALRHKVDALPWEKLETTPGSLDTQYIGKHIDLDSCEIELTKVEVSKAAVKYGRAIAHVAMMYRYLMTKKIPFELEVSVDETDTPTTHAEHIFIASELKRLGVEFISLAPRYIGKFEKGVDYIGDVSEFEKSFAVHAEIARALGPYKLSLHSGSDKFSVYAIALRHTRGLVHLKTAGTSYLEALRTIAALDPIFFREIYIFARGRYETDRATYHVSATLVRAPKPEQVTNQNLPSLLNQFDARQILHVTFGSVLNERDTTNQLKFYDKLMATLRANPEAYAVNLEKHFARHVAPFVQES